MALKRAQVDPNAKFEEEDGGTTVAEQPAGSGASEQAKPPADQEAAAKAETKTAIAKAATSSAVALSGGKVVSLMGPFKDVMPPVDFDTFPRLVGSNGNVMDQDDEVLGTWIKVQLISWNDLWVISPGSDEDESKEFVRYSHDGKTIDETGESVADYVKMLRETEGYDKAKSKQYLELICLLLESEKPSDHLGNMVKISLSPKSRSSFQANDIQESVKVALGKRTAEGADILKITTDIKASGKNKFTLLKVASA